jgi:hypothetical protein
VNVAEKILEAFEIFAPGGGVFGEQSFEGVAEALQADAEFVPWLGLFAALGAIVEFFGFFEALEGEAFGGQAAYGYEADAVAQVTFEFRPFLFVEFGGGTKGVVGALLLVGFERG